MDKSKNIWLIKMNLDYSFLYFDNINYYNREYYKFKFEFSSKENN